jgi:putative GTP pyrophosphokinase
MYEAWGALVSSELSNFVAQRIRPEALSDFFKIPVTIRPKGEQQLIDKAFHRGKPYASPYDDIEDKIGVRVVVLFSEDVRIVEDVIKSSSTWSAMKARDWQEEQALSPYEFTYQSLHYVVKSRCGQAWNGTAIMDHIPCEVQVRTLLQHAYSELTHDTIYKPNVAAAPEVKRAAAKSMALIEATGDYFSEVKRTLARVSEPGEKVASILRSAYETFVHRPGEATALNTLIIDHYKAWAKDDFSESLSRYLADKPWLAQRILERIDSDLLYRQPGILLVYWVISQARNAAANNSPLSDDELSLMYSDLGYTLPGIA